MKPNTNFRRIYVSIRKKLHEKEGNVQNDSSKNDTHTHTTATTKNNNNRREIKAIRINK